MNPLDGLVASFSHDIGRPEFFRQGNSFGVTTHNVITSYSIHYTKLYDRRPARWLASHQAEQFPAAAEPALEQMRAEARIILAQDELTSYNFV